MTVFRPERISLQEFHVDETTTVMTPLMTHTGHYRYLNDKVNIRPEDLQSHAYLHTRMSWLDDEQEDSAHL